MGPLMEAMGIPTEGLNADTMINMGFRIVDKGGKIWMEEHYGDKKEYMAVLNEEYDYERPGETILMSSQARLTDVCCRVEHVREEDHHQGGPRLLQDRLQEHQDGEDHRVHRDLH